MQKVFTKVLLTIVMLATILSTVTPIVHADNGNVQSTDVTITVGNLTEEDYEKIFRGEFQSYTIDEQGNMISNYSSSLIGAVIKKILVWVKDRVVETLYGEVVNGVVRRVTGKDIGGWLESEIQLKVIGKPYRQNVYLNWGPFTCPGVVIDHSGICH